MKCALVWILAGSLLAHAAHAADPKRVPASAEMKEAQRLKQQGDAFMEQYAYPDAYALYQQAYAVQAEPALVYNMARALQGMGEYPEALARLEQFDRDAPPAVKAKVPLLAELVADVRSHVSTLVVHCEVQNARILVRNRDVGVVGSDHPVRIVAGPATVEILADGYDPFQRSVTLAPGDTLTLDAKLSLRQTHGRIVVRVTPAGGMVEIDRIAVGPAPLDARVLPGAHALAIRHGGYVEQRTSLYLAAGETRQVQVTLEPKLVTRWWLWTGVALLVVGGAVLTAAMLSDRPADQGTSFSPTQIHAPLRF